LERMLKLIDAGVEDGWIEREEKLCVVHIKVGFKESDEMRLMRKLQKIAKDENQQLS